MGMTLNSYLRGKVSWFEEPIRKIIKHLRVDEDKEGIGSIIRDLWEDDLRHKFIYSSSSSNDNSRQIHKLFKKALYARFSRNIIVRGELT